MDFDKADSSHIVNNMTEIKQHFSDIEQSYRLKRFMSYERVQYYFPVGECFNKLECVLAYNQNDSALKPLKCNLYYSFEKLHKWLLLVFCMYQGDMFSNASIVNYFPRFEKIRHWK